MSSEIDVEAHESEIGYVREFDFGVISRRETRRYARAAEDDNPLFHDVEYARSRGYDDLVVPPNFLPAIIEPNEGIPAEELREDGLDPSGHAIEIPLNAAVVGGGQTIQFDRYVTAGERIRVEETFDDLYQKEGAARGTLTFIETTARFFDEQDDRVLICEKITIAVDQ